MTQLSRVLDDQRSVLVKRSMIAVCKKVFAAHAKGESGRHGRRGSSAAENSRREEFSLLADTWQVHHMHTPCWIPDLGTFVALAPWPQCGHVLPAMTGYSSPCIFPCLYAASQTCTRGREKCLNARVKRPPCVNLYSQFLAQSLRLQHAFNCV